MSDPHKKRNYLFLLLDGCEFSVFEDMEAARVLAPNLCKIIDQGFVKRIVSNGMITQVSLPAILTQTYPLDFGGYNYGIKNRPKSIIELFKEGGYHTYFIAAHDITGPRRQYERGADVVRGIYDNDDIVEDYIRLILYYEIHRYRAGLQSRDEVLEILTHNFSEILIFAERSGDRFDRRFTPRRLRMPTNRTAALLRSERELLNREPDAILHKLELISSQVYQNFLGEDLRSVPKERIEKRVRRYIQKLNRGNRINGFCKRYTGLGLSIYPTYLSPTAEEVIDEAVKLMPQNSPPWFMFMQLMDHHDGAKSSRYFRFIKTMKYIPMVRALRKRKPTHRDFWRDLSLVYMDKGVKRLIDRLDAAGNMSNTCIVAFGDHGMGWDSGRGSALMADLGLRTHYEHIAVPLIVSDPSNEVVENGVHDGMSISATLLSEAGIPHHDSFLGRSIYEKGKAVAIVENVGRGNCDAMNRDLYFTVVSPTHKLMMILVEQQMEIIALYDLREDQREFRNVVAEPDNKKIIETLLRCFVAERSTLLLKRGVSKDDVLKRYMIIDRDNSGRSDPRAFHSLPTLIGLNQAVL